MLLTSFSNKMGCVITRRKAHKKRRSFGRKKIFRQRARQEQQETWGRGEEDLTLTCRQEIRMDHAATDSHLLLLYKHSADHCTWGLICFNSWTREQTSPTEQNYQTHLEPNWVLSKNGHCKDCESHPLISIRSECTLIVCCLVFVNITKAAILLLNQQPVDNEWLRNMRSLQAYTRGSLLSLFLCGTYRKASGQSSLDIHCHSICAGVGNPRAVHLRVGLVPYR